MKIIAWLLLGLPLIAGAQEWLTVSRSTQGDHFEFLKGSFQVTTDGVGAPEIGVTERWIDVGGVVHVSNVVTEVSMCRQGYGVLTTFPMGGEAEYSNDVVHGGRQVASIEFDLLCEIYSRELRS